MKGKIKFYEKNTEVFNSTGGWFLIKEEKPFNNSYSLTKESYEYVVEKFRLGEIESGQDIDYELVVDCSVDQESGKSFHRILANIIYEKPETKKVFLIDIDGTICEDIKNEDSHLYPTAKVIQGSLEQINKWAEEGHTITFFTAREEKDRVVTLKWLWENGFKFHNLVMDKPRIQDGQEYVWIDNRKVRAVTYLGVWSELKDVDAKIKIFG
jgi:hypothetical protein